MNKSNIGWSFYKNYYRDNTASEKWFPINNSPEDGDKKQKMFFDKKHRYLMDTAIDNNLLDISCKHKLVSEISYPGLALGLGYAHETGLTGEIKLGCSFDHTTGIPIIPASQIKGMLRSCFPQKIVENKDGVLPKDLQDQNRSIIKEFLKFKKTAFKESPIEKFDLVDLLEAEIFEGKELLYSKKDEKWGLKPQSFYKRDIFLDAYPMENSKFLAIGNITPHNENITKNPIPLLFLKLKSGTKICFQFDLKDGKIIKKEDKLDLFKNILEFTGIGAKTNVGYGQFESINNQ